MTDNTVDSTFSVSGRIDKKVHDISDLTSTDEEFEDLTQEEKLEVARQTEPEQYETIYNVTTDDLHKYFVRNLNPSDTSPSANIGASWIALGTNGPGGSSSGDDDLNDRVYEQQVTDFSSNGTQLLCSSFIGSSDGGGYTFNELGLFSGNPANIDHDDVFMLNHATFQNVEKSNTKTVIFDVTLTFTDG